jgi:ankyrin repeat protein
VKTRTVDRALIQQFIDAAVRDHSHARHLLELHPELLEARFLLGETVLHFLAVENFVEGVRFLAEAGAGVDATNEFGDTALIDVAVLGNDVVAEVLLQFGANPNAQSDTKDNVLDAAVRSSNARLVDLLLTAGARPDYETDLGFTILDALPTKEPKRTTMLDVLRRHGVSVPA